MIPATVDGTAIFSASLNATSQKGWLQERVLSQAIDQFTKGNYEQAVKNLTRAVGHDPTSANAVKAYQLMGQAYSKLEDSDNAIKAYQAALKLSPGNVDAHTALGNIHYFYKRYDQAIASYAAAVKYDPSAGNRYSLGQGYLADGQLQEAETQFTLVNSQAPNRVEGVFGLGLVASKRGEYEQAADYFRQALDIQPDYQEASVELAYALANMGEIDDAKAIKADIAENDSTTAYQLGLYITSKSAPRITQFASADFNTSLGPRTALSDLSFYLAAPDYTQTFSVQLFFSKAMDVTSVQNIYNWSIERSTGGGPGEAYNFGNTVPDTEASIARLPLGVYYDSTSQSATLLFSITQNAAADGTIDPSHIRFSFRGKDADGLTMDTKADQYMGFSGFA